jgi:hypothetical protein
MAKKQRRKRLPQISNELNQKLLENASKSSDEILDIFHTTPNGLDSEQYEKLKEQYGPNAIGVKKQHQ